MNDPLVQKDALKNAGKLQKQIGNLVVIVFTLIINMLAVLLPLNNKTTQAISDAYPNLFVPANITFSIWSVIYTLLIVFAIYQARDLFNAQKIDMPFLEKINYWMIANGLLNTLWIFMWHFELILPSIFVMLGVLGTLVIMFLNLGIGRSSVGWKERIAVHLPISVYLGWITVATVANVTAVIVSLDLVINGLFLGIEEGIWAAIVILVAVAITLVMIYDRKDIGYSLVVIWALLGIYLKRSVNDLVYGVRPDVAMIAMIGLIIIAAGLIVRYAYDYV